MEQERNNVAENSQGGVENNVAIDEKAAKKARMRARRLERRHRRNARIARFRTLKNFFIWILGVIFLPVIIVATSFVVPIGTFTGNNGEIVSHDLEKKSIFETVRYVASNSDELGFSDFPIIASSLDELMNNSIGEGKTVGDLIYIDTDKLNTIKLGSSDLSGEIQSCVEVIATIGSLTSKESLGDFGSLIFEDGAEEAGTVAVVVAKDEDAKTKLQYYYKPSELGTTTMSSASGEFKRAFDKDGNLADELKNLSDTDKGVVKLYYPPMQDIKLSELVDVFGASFGRKKVKALFEVFGIAEDSTVVKIVGTDKNGNDMTIAGLGDFDINAVKLNVVLSEENTKLWDVLKAATNKDQPDSDPVTIGDLTSFNINSVKLSVVLDKKEEPQSSDYATTEEYDAAKKSYETNKKLWDVLEAATNKDEITLGDLANDFDLDNVPLNDVIKEDESNEKLWSILRQATIHKDGTSLNDDETITVGHLANGFKIEKVKLVDVIKVDEGSANNDKLWDILEQAITDDNGNPIDRNDITLNDLNYHFKPDNIKLTTVLPNNTEQQHKLYSILRDATGVTGETEEEANEKITISSLSFFTVGNIHLNTVMGDVSTNRVLSALKEKNITVGEIGTALNGLSLYEVYGKTAFKLAGDGENLDTARSFYKVFDENGEMKYMLESLSVVTSAERDAFDKYYACYTNDVLNVVEAQKTLVELGGITDPTIYRKCTHNTTHHISILPEPIDTETYTVDTSVVYRKTVSNDFVKSNYEDTWFYKITEENSNEFFVDSRDLLIKADTESYYACKDGETFKGYYKAADIPSGYTNDGLTYTKSTDSLSNTVYVLDDKYYLDRDAGIWLLLSFDTAEYSGDVATRRFADQDGKAYKYVIDIDTSTIGSLQNGGTFTKKFKNSTIKQLVDFKLVDNINFTNMRYSLQEILELAARAGVL